MFRESDSLELTNVIADYIHDRSYGNIECVQYDGKNVLEIAGNNGSDYEITSIVYDGREQDTACEVTLTIFTPAYNIVEYGDQLCGYTFDDVNAWYDSEELDTGEYEFRLYMSECTDMDDMQEMASLVCANFIPIIEYAG